MTLTRIKSVWTGWMRRGAPTWGEGERYPASAVLRDLAHDMEAAAIEAGDQSCAGPGRVFAAQRAAVADELRKGCGSGAGEPLTGRRALVQERSPCIRQRRA
ncbi:hypothetical protein [Nocardia salmonicida]|uniref:hypothetical protein n=1 Tax=Nocardia salmonicida TaxID=53431 RepID=UPI003CEC8C63